MTQTAALSGRAAKFAHMTALLAQYTAANDGANPPQWYKTPAGEPLGEWVSTQRSRYRGVRSRAPLSAQEVAALEAAGIIWDAPRGRAGATTVASSQEYLAAIAAYKAKEGHANPPARTEFNGLKIGFWLRNQRQSESQGRLDPALRAALADLGVRFRDRGTVPSKASTIAREARVRVADQHFAGMVARLVEHKQATGHARPARSYVHPDGTALGVWLSDQRQAYLRGDLSADRVAALEALGVVWVDKPGRRDFERTFAARLGCVTRYSAENDGNGNAPASYRCDHAECDKRDLGQWLHRLRKKYLKDVREGTSKITAEQIAALVAVGVDLDPQGRAAAEMPLAA